MTHTISRSPRGSDAQFGYEVETSWGTQVTPVTNFLPTTAGGIGIVKRDGRIASAGRIPGRTTRIAAYDVMYDNGGEGSITMELLRDNMLKLWRWAIGHNPTPAQQAATIAYLTTFNKSASTGAMDATGSSLSIQVGIPLRGGGVEPFDYIGCKCPGWQMSCDAGGIATVTFDVDAVASQNTDDLAVPSYPATYVPLGWYSAAVVKRAGSALPGVNSVSFKTENGISGEGRKQWDGTGKYATPIFAKDMSAELQLEIEPSSLALTYDDWVSNTPRAWVVELVGANIASSYFYTWRLTIANGYIKGDPPKAGGDDVVTHGLTIEAVDDGTNPLYKLEVMETATTI